MQLVATGAFAMQGVRNIPDGKLQQKPKCGREDRQLTIATLPTTPYSLMRTNPCLSDMAPLYEYEVEDVADAVEYLGKLSYLSGDGCTKQLSPSFFYLGMEHAGSTTLADRLNAHNQLSFGSTKEHRFWTKFGHNTFSETPTEYLEEFTVDCDVAKTFDATPNMFALPLTDTVEECHVFDGVEGNGPKAMEELKNTIGNNTKFLVMLRDPIKVANSRFQLRPFQKQAEYALKFCDCFQRGISEWMQYYPKENFYFLRSDDLFQKPEITFEGVLNFLDVDVEQHNKQKMEATGRRRATVAPDTPLARQSKYKEDIQTCQNAISELSGLKLDWGAGKSM